MAEAVRLDQALANVQVSSHVEDDGKWMGQFMELRDLRTTSRRLWDKARAYVTKTPERKWTAAGIGLGFGVALIFVPPLGIAAFGGAIAGWWIVVGVVTVFGAFAGNRAGIEVERRQAQREQRNERTGG